MKNVKWNEYKRVKMVGELKKKHEYNDYDEEGVGNINNIKK